MSLFEELKRRNVFRVGIAYVISAWILMQFVDLVLENVNAPDWVMQVFMLALAIGFPLAVFFAWAFEMTPDGIKKEQDVDRSQSVTPKTGRKLDRSIIIVMAIALAYFGYDKFSGKGPGSISPEVAKSTEPAVDGELNPAPANQKLDLTPSIAVLPFVNMSSDPEQEYFSDGISEEILNVLARIPELKVAARTSAFAYKGTKINISEIAKELKVDHVLEGSVRKSGNQVRITAQLIKADDGYHLWSETFDRELTNIFAIQDEIATSIAAALKVTLKLQASVAGNLTGTTSTQAYDAYLRGMNQWHLRTGESLRNSIGLFEQAIAIDAQFARAHAGLALTWVVIMDYTEIPFQEAADKAKTAAENALAIDPGLIEAATALIYTTDDVEQQLERSKQAIALNPSFATTHQWYAASLALIGDLDAAMAEYLQALELDPRSRVINANLSDIYMQMARWEDAERVLQQLLSWAPDYTGGLGQVFLLKILTGDRAGAQQAGQQLVRALNRAENTVDLYLNIAFDPLKRAAAMREVLAWPQQDWWSPDNPHLLADEVLIWVLASVGEFDQARAMLAELIKNNPSYVYGNFRTNHSIPAFVCDPGVQEMLAATKLPPLKVPYPCEELLP